MEYQMPVRAIKNIMRKEIQEHYSVACQDLHHDVQRNFVHVGYRYILAELEKCVTYDELDNFLSLADYRMSLQEWINSL